MSAAPGQKDDDAAECFDRFSTEYSTSAEYNEFLYSGEKGETTSEDVPRVR